MQHAGIVEMHGKQLKAVVGGEKDGHLWMTLSDPKSPKPIVEFNCHVSAPELEESKRYGEAKPAKPPEPPPADGPIEDADTGDDIEGDGDDPPEKPEEPKPDAKPKKLPATPGAKKEARKLGVKLKDVKAREFAKSVSVYDVRRHAEEARKKEVIGE